jgi:hypothetical protein
MLSALANHQGSQQLFLRRRPEALGAQVVDLIGLHLLDDQGQIGAVGGVAVVEGESGIALVVILMEVSLWEG